MARVSLRTSSLWSILDKTREIQPGKLLCREYTGQRSYLVLAANSGLTSSSWSPFYILLLNPCPLSYRQKCNKLDKTSHPNKRNTTKNSPSPQHIFNLQQTYSLQPRREDTSHTSHSHTKRYNEITKNRNFDKYSFSPLSPTPSTTQTLHNPHKNTHNKQPHYNQTQTTKQHTTTNDTPPETSSHHL